MAVAIALSPAAQQVEDWLRERGQEPEYQPEFPVGEIDMDRSLKNQARLIDPINEETVTQYAAAMQAGDEFPPIIVAVDKKSYVLVSGIHRSLAALSAGLETFPAFILRTDHAAAISVLTYEANATHGRPTSEAERVQQALFLVESGLSQADAAKLLRVASPQLARAVRIRRGRERLTALGFKRVNLFADTTVDRLASIRADNIFLSAAALVRDAAMPFEAVNDLIVRMNKMRSEEEQMNVLMEEVKLRKAEAAAKLGGTVKLPRSITRVAQSVGNAAKVPVPSEKDMKLVPADYRKNLLESVTRAQNRLTDIEQALRKPR